MKIKKIIKVIILFVLICLPSIIFFISKNSERNNSSNENSLCEKYSLYAVILNNKIKSVNYCSNPVSKYKEITATLFEKNNNSINEINTFAYSDDSAILLDKFLMGKAVNVNTKNELYFEVKLLTSDNKIELINIPVVMEGKTK